MPEEVGHLIRRSWVQGVFLFFKQGSPRKGITKLLTTVNTANTVERVNKINTVNTIITIHYQSHALSTTRCKNNTGSKQHIDKITVKS